MKYHLTPVRMAIISKQQVLARMWRKGNTDAALVGMKLGAATVESSTEFPKKIVSVTALFHFCRYIQRNLKHLI